MDLSHLLETISAERNIFKKEIMVRELVEAINTPLQEIKKCKTLEDAESYFKILEKAVDVVAILVYQNEVYIPHQLRKLYSDFDRIDDMWWREYLFNKIKIHNYSFEGNSALHERFQKID